jgi:signal transduction histidine kinase
MPPAFWNSSAKLPRRLARRLGLALLALAIFPSARAQSGSEIEGTVEFVRPLLSGRCELELVAGTNRARLPMDEVSGNVPALSSRIRVAPVSGLNQIQFVTGLALPLVTNAAELRRLGSAGQHIWCVAHLDGLVLGVSRGRGTFALQDDTGVALLEPQTPGRRLAPGQKLSLEGNCLVEGDHAFLCDLPIVDNNDIHAMTEKSGAIFLTAGKHPLRLAWFNREYPYGLEVYFQGPALPRQRIPDAALFRHEPRGGGPWTQGLDYRCYEGGWLRVPNFDRLIPAKEGTAANFNLGLITRTNDVGLQFSGYVEVPREGVYTFSLISDDGSLLFMDEKPPWMEVTGTNALPDPLPVTARQILREDQEGRWAQLDGTVTFASEQSGALELELSSDTGLMRVEVADSSGGSPQTLVNSRIRATGICLGARATDGQKVAATLLAPGMGQIELLEPQGDRGSDPPANSAGNPAALPTLHTIEQIKRLTREEWQTGYPVKIRGVITTVLDGGFFIQDSTRSIYARWWSPTDNEVPRVGDYWEVEGKTFAEFAPNIQASRATRLDAGVLPEPLHPTWDQLMNGSLDTEYVEVQGIVTALECNGVDLLTRAGKIRLELPDVQPQALRRYENALVRVRGCAIPVRDIHTQQVQPGQMRLSNASITVDKPAPADPFATKIKRVSDLFLFDSRAGALQRVKVGGQILQSRGGEYYLMDGRDGLRFIPKEKVELQTGDLAEVVGFLDLGSPSPVLREAVARRSGHAPLPEPRTLPPNALLSRRYDATLVRVEGRLTGLRFGPAEEVLELQAGAQRFVARLNKGLKPQPGMSLGTLLELTGVYVGQGSDLASGRDIGSFELLLNSPSDITALARPPWWTVRRALTVLGGMACVILIALFWIALLRRQVEERSDQLAVEIRRHEHTERQREMEEERARIARDLHDDLGATLTQIRFLSALESRDGQLPETTRHRMGQVSEKSREMVASLDEIVWAVNPANDSLPILANYLCHFAEEFFRSASIRCRLDVDDSLPPAPLTSEVRHNIYLAVREALNNIAKHSQATEVWLRIHWQPPGVGIAIEDNGRGFSPLSNGCEGEGLTNMRQRLEKIGGRFECESRPGAGAVCLLFLPIGLPSVK